MNIRSLILGATALTALSLPAFAADLPSRAAPPVFVPPPSFTWTGFYAGGDVGYEFGNVSFTILGTGATHSTGIIGGGHVGYNYETSGLGIGGLVVGLEGDVSGTDAKATFAGLISTKDSIQGSVRGRLGIAVDRALFYATGGAAFATFQDNFFNALFVSRSRVGYTIGGGVEYAILPNWSLRAQYTYSDYGTFTPVTVPVVVTQRITENKATVGFSYLFTTPTPVVARY